MAQQDTVGRRATTARTDKAGVLSVVYHNTEVVRATPKTITLDSGGWQTQTTKTRMNQASNQYGLGFRVTQNKHQWFVEHHGRTVKFTDGLTFTRGEA